MKLYFLLFFYSILFLVTINLPVKVELVNIRTIFELTGGKDFKDPEKIESIVVSSIVLSFNVS